MTNLITVIYFIVVLNEENEMWNALCFQEKLSAQHQVKRIGQPSLGYGFPRNIEYEIR